jgi:DNA-binding FadR family transcriptional regulator
MFATLPRPETSVHACEKALLADIVAGRLAPESRLPPERRLCESLGVNRTTLRAALGRLERAGLVRVRQGSGYVVQDFRASGGLDLLPALAAHARREGSLAAVAADLLLLRRKLAEAVLERLIARRTPKLARALDAAIESFAADVATIDDPADRAARDLELLGAIVELCESPVLRLCLNPVGAALRAMPELTRAIYADPTRSVTAYRALSLWLRESKPDTTAMIALLSAHDARSVAALEARRSPEGER